MELSNFVKVEKNPAYSNQNDKNPIKRIEKIYSKRIHSMNKFQPSKFFYKNNKI